MRGIDISHYNGWPFNATTNKAYEDSDFVIVKATQGTNYKYVGYFKPAIDTVIADGKLAGAYHYAAGNDPIAEADYFISQVRPYLGKIILALDWEANQNKAWKNTHWVKKFIDRVKDQTGQTCFLYANMEGISQCKEVANKVPLWFAGYPENKNSWSIPKWPSHYSTKPWTHYDIWQYTSGEETLDRNISNFTINDWINYAGGKVEDMKVTAKTIIDIMLSWKGLSKKDKSHKVIIDLYNSYKPLARGYKVSYSDNYCAVTISAAFIKAHAVDLIGGTECSVQKFIDIFKRKGIWEENGKKTPKPGWIITFNWDDDTQPNDGWADHIGLVKSVENGVITTIEGNYGGEVKERRIKVGDGCIRGYAVPQYKEEEEKKDTSRDFILKLTVDTLQGKYGIGETRKQKLGIYYADVQNIINHVTKADVTTLAKEVIAGDFGNGDTRRIILGDRYSEVQKKVNELV